MTDLTSRDEEITHEEQIEQNQISIVQEMGLGLSRDNDEAVNMDKDRENSMDKEFTKKQSLLRLDYSII